MENKEIVLRQKKLLEEVFFLKENFTQNERKELIIKSNKKKYNEY